MKLSDFDYSLPKELIAQYPAKPRQKCRLMVLDRRSGSIEHKIFEDITGYIKEGDLLVLNDTKVIPARLFARRKTGGKVELFLLEKKNPVCEALLRPSSRIKEGECVELESGDRAEILGRGPIGRLVRFSRPLDDILKSAGHIPLPPYIERIDEESDRNDYQTAYADKEGATASPTAGLHFTGELLDKVKGQGARVKYVTLHTNYGTFAPVKTDDVEKHKMHKEYFDLPQDTANAIAETKKAGNKVFAVGTTTSRVLEHCADFFTNIEQRTTNDVSGFTDLYIYPGYGFKVVDHLITNFHLPKSTLMLLVSAFAGRDFIMKAYQEAIAKQYRFFSYGDAMLIL
jgi:S-adenosylmethionine:tRNA ribosyltransferase-isomerase